MVCTTIFRRRWFTFTATEIATAATTATTITTSNYSTNYEQCLQKKIFFKLEYHNV